MAVIKGNSSNNNLVGTPDNDSIYGYAGNDILDGKGGIDTLIGGTGNDTYIVDSTTDKITELSGGGTDTVKSSVSYTLGAYLNNLTLTGSSTINGTGNEYDNTITGNSANNILNGGAGIDTLVGGLGNDTYIVDSTTDTITELSNGGIDTVQSSVSYTLGQGSFLNNLTLTGTSAIDGIGNEYDNSISGNDANNILFGGNGNDKLNGGKGDRLFGAAGNDYLTGSGIDRGGSPPGSLYMDGGDGNDTLVGDFGDLYGGNGDDSLTSDFEGNQYGGNGNDTLDGDDGSVLYGEDGNDILLVAYGAAAGGDGDDVLTGGDFSTISGGNGNDTLTGSPFYQFNDPREGVDAITDFSSSGDEILVFAGANGFGGGLTPGAAITPEQFRLGSSASDTSDRFIYNTDGALFFDEDGTGGAGQIQFATLTGVPLLTNNDIVATANFFG